MAIFSQIINLEVISLGVFPYLCHTKIKITIAA